MKNDSNKKAIINGTELGVVVKELLEISRKREAELAELDRIAKMLVRRDLALTELKENKEKEFQQLQKRSEELEEARQALMNILEDIEEARALALEERDKTLAIITNFTDGLLVFDKNNLIALVNPQAEIFFQTKQEQVLGRFLPELAQIPLFKPLAELLAKEPEKVFRREIGLSENLILEVSVLPVASMRERLGSLVILHDITREKMIERMKTEFVSLAAHQLRTPLSAIKWTLRMLLDGDLGRITPEQRSFIDRTYLSNERMIRLINDLLDVTRIEEGRYLYKPSFVRLEDIIQFVVNSYQRELQRKDLELIFKKPKEKLPLLKLDVEKMRLAVQNLLDNAVRYTGRGGQIRITLTTNQEEVQFKIKDNGIGIPEDQQSRIFAKFFRGANAIRTATEGSGLGLFIVKNIIAAHGGRIWFESSFNKGSAFYFALPIVATEFEEFIKGF